MFFYKKNTFLKKILHSPSARNGKCIANPIHKVLKERIGDIDFREGLGTHACRFEIKSKDEGFSFFLRDMTAENVSFSSWPVLKLKIEGEDFDGSILTRIMPAALGLQKEIYRTYALAKFGKPDICKLSRTDRRRSEIVVKVEKGSANFIIALDVIINWITRTEMMPEPAIAIVGLATVFGGGRYAKSIVNNREETKRTEVEAKKLVFLSQEETECARIITGMARENVVLQRIPQ